MKEYNGKPLVEGLLEEIEYVYKSDKRPWVIGYSGGKDSTVVVHLVYQMLKNLRPEERHKTVYIVSSDTLVESNLSRMFSPMRLFRLKAILQLFYFAIQ